MKTLIIYYSYDGNTKQIAEIIRKETSADIVEIETVKPYIGDYNSVVDQGKQEIDSGFMPEIKPISVNFSDYGKIFLGTPVWWYTFAPAVKSFFEKYGAELSGKDIFPFVTNGGWIGKTVKNISDACPSAKVGKAINIKFDGNALSTSEKDILKWLKECGKK